HYFPTTLQASGFLGFRSDVVGKAVRRAERENENFGRAVVSGIEFTSVNRAYQNAREIDLPNAHPILRRHFPWLFRENGSVIWKSREAQRSRGRYNSAATLSA